MNPNYTLVANRANHRCEYCHAPELVFNFPFEVEHIVPLSRQGTVNDENLALACRSCNLRKSNRISGIDSESNTEVRFFHPRLDQWKEHFQADATSGTIIGMTAIGRTTVSSLEMNSQPQVTARLLWIRLGSISIKCLCQPQQVKFNCDNKTEAISVKAMPSDKSKLIELPSTDELACSDDIPVDNEDQNFLPNILLFLLNSIWANRTDWFFGVDMAIYHTTGANPRVPVVPDGFLSLGVERKKGGKSRRSYAVWEEDNIVPILTLEIVSYTPGNEYDEKLEIYRKLGVLYYIIYNPEYWQRDQHQPLSVYKLVDGDYELQIKEPLWLPEIGLGIGRHQGEIGGIEQEFLSWYDESGNRYLMPEEIAIQQKLKAQAEEERAEQLAKYLRSKGIDPDNLPSN